jgi:hypothetical protein
MDNRKELSADYLEKIDWKAFQNIVDCFKPFYLCTLNLQGKVKQRRHGAI